jgi:hypothetical protein
MTYLDFEKEYIKDRPTEPYSENEDASNWANLTRYAEDNLQKAYNFGYCECFYKAKDIIEKLLVFIPNKNEYFQQASDDIRLIVEKFIEVEK